MIINFDELNFDATDADTLQKYLDAMQNISERQTGLIKTLRSQNSICIFVSPLKHVSMVYLGLALEKKSVVPTTL